MAWDLITHWLWMEKNMFTQHQSKQVRVFWESMTISPNTSPKQEKATIIRWCPEHLSALSLLSEAHIFGLLGTDDMNYRVRLPSIYLHVVMSRVSGVWRRRCPSSWSLSAGRDLLTTCGLHSDKLWINITLPENSWNAPWPFHILMQMTPNTCWFVARLWFVEIWNGYADVQM